MQKVCLFYSQNNKIVKYDYQTRQTSFGKLTRCAKVCGLCYLDFTFRMLIGWADKFRSRGIKKSHTSIHLASASVDFAATTDSSSPQLVPALLPEPAPAPLEATAVFTELDDEDTLCFLELSSSPSSSPVANGEEEALPWPSDPVLATRFVKA